MTAQDKAWVDVGAVDDVPLQGARTLRTARGCVAVFRTMDGALYALENKCPHRGGPLAQGIVHDHFVTCPLHSWVFSLQTGEAQGADSGSVQTFSLKVEDGRILVDATVLAAQAAE